MINLIKRLFGIKPTEAKVEVAPVVEVTQVTAPEPAPAPVAEPVVEAVVESTAPVVEVTTTEFAPAKVAKIKKTPAKPRAKKTAK